MTPGLLGNPSSEQPTNSGFAVHKLVTSALPKGLDHIRRLARGDTESADLAAALADRERPPPDKSRDGLMTVERMQARSGAHHEALAARAAAREVVSDISRLPPKHIAALLRMSALRRGTGTATLAGWKERLDRLDADDAVQPGRRLLFENHGGITGAGELLAALQPSAAEATQRGTHYVKGDEPEIRKAADSEAAGWAVFYNEHPAALSAVEDYEARERMDPGWHRRKIRREALRAGAYWDSAMRLARPACPHVSDYTLDGWRQRQANGRAWAAGQAVRFEDGTEVPLADIQARGKKARRATTYAILKGMEHYGQANNYTAFFITITVPGHFHSMIKGLKAADGTYPHAYPNPNWQPEFGPAAAWKALSDLWATLRARLAKIRDLRNWFGISVPEPHHDGTPHLHALVWLPSHVEHRGRRRGSGLILKDILHDIAPGHQSRLEIVRKQPDRNRPDGTVRRFLSPASYVMKYAMKSIDDDDTLTAQGDAGQRHRAWASSRGIRRMRLVGAHGSIRVWQRLWTSTAKERLPERAEAARAAMRRSAAAGEMATAAAPDSAARAEARAEQAAAAAEALELIGGLPGATHKFKLGYDDAETEHGRPTRKAVRIEEYERGEIAGLDGKPRIGWVATGAAFALKRQAAELVEIIAGQDPASGMVTVAASYPSSQEESQARPLDPGEYRYIMDTERAVAERDGLPQWQQWCADRRERLARLRRPPPDTSAGRATATCSASSPKPPL